MFQRSSPVVETVAGRSSRSRATSEQVASKLIPATASGARPASSRAAFAAPQTALPDVLARLLGVVRPRLVHQDRAAGAGEHFPSGVEQRGPRAAGADVDRDHHLVRHRQHSRVSRCLVIGVVYPGGQAVLNHACDREAIMLKGLDPLLGADLLHVLRSMGHGDELVIVDANFPAAGSGPRVVRLDGISATRALEAVLSVMPLDDFVDQACARMEVVGDPDALPEICKEFQQIIEAAEGSRFQLASLERFAFYERARQAFALVQTGETRLYGNVLLKMGIVRPA